MVNRNNYLRTPSTPKRKKVKKKEKKIQLTSYSVVFRIAKSVDKNNRYGVEVSNFLLQNRQINKNRNVYKLQRCKTNINLSPVCLMKRAKK